MTWDISMWSEPLGVGGASSWRRRGRSLKLLHDVVAAVGRRPRLRLRRLVDGAGSHAQPPPLRSGRCRPGRRGGRGHRRLRPAGMGGRRDGSRRRADSGRSGGAWTSGGGCCTRHLAGGRAPRLFNDGTFAHDGTNSALVDCRGGRRARSWRLPGPIVLCPAGARLRYHPFMNECFCLSGTAISWLDCPLPCGRRAGRNVSPASGMGPSEGWFGQGHGTAPWPVVGPSVWPVMGPPPRL